jgi:hypothetical protein
MINAYQQKKQNLKAMGYKVGRNSSKVTKWEGRAITSFLIGKSRRAFIN